MTTEWVYRCPCGHSWREADKFADDRVCYKAEEFAREAGRLIPAIKSLIDLQQMVTLRDGGRLLDVEQRADLLRFIQARHANYRMGGNVKSSAPELNANS